MPKDVGTNPDAGRRWTMTPVDPRSPPDTDPPRQAFRFLAPFQLMLFGGGAALIGGLLLAAVFMGGG